MNRKPIISSSALLVLLLVASGARRMTVLTPADAQTLEEAEKRISISGLNSPREIEQYVNGHTDEADLSEIWARFGIVTESGLPGRCGCRKYDCPGACKAQAIQISSRRGNQDYEILRICYADELACWFLLFKKEGDWKFLGAAESQENKYEGVKHKIVSCRNERWLVVKEGTGGTGFLSYVERWFEVSNKGLAEVLSYPVVGHSVQGDPDDYELRSKVRSETRENDCGVAVHYEILRNSVFKPTFRWTTSVRRQLQFVWDTSARRFLLDKVNSDLSDAQHNPVLGYLARHGYLN